MNEEDTRLLQELELLEAIAMPVPPTAEDRKFVELVGSLEDDAP